MIKKNYLRVCIGGGIILILAVFGILWLKNGNPLLLYKKQPETKNITAALDSGVLADLQLGLASINSH